MLVAMGSPMSARRERLRAFPLDGALLFFQPATGRSLRVESERTPGPRRQAPRLAAASRSRFAASRIGLMGAQRPGRPCFAVVSRSRSQRLRGWLA